MVVASLALAFGDDDSSGTGTQSGLGSERMSARERVRRPVALDGDDAEIGEYRPVLDEYRKECNKLDADDALLADFRRFCPLLADLQKRSPRPAWRDEAQRQQCLDGVSGFRGVVRRFLREGERLDGVIERRSGAACKKALVTPMPPTR